MLLLLLATGLVIYACGERLAGGWGGAFALCWFATMPAFLAFGPLVLTDTAVALFSLAALWSFATLWRDQTPRRHPPLRARAHPGVALEILGRTAAVRFPRISFCIALVAAGRPTRRARVPRLVAPRLAPDRQRRTDVGAAGLRRSSSCCRGTNPPICSSSSATDGPRWRCAGCCCRWSIYLGGVVMFAMESVRPSYLFGHAYPHGVWFFFPVMLLKSTLAFRGRTGAQPGGRACGPLWPPTHRGRPRGHGVPLARAVAGNRDRHIRLHDQPDDDFHPPLYGPAGAAGAAAGAAFRGCSRICAIKAGGGRARRFGLRPRWPPLRWLPWFARGRITCPF